MIDPNSDSDSEAEETETPAPPKPAVIRLDDFLKRHGLVGTGGEAKIRIQTGEVLVNGVVETRRRKQLALGDVVQAVGESITVAADCFD
ncbi:MAG: RNA-binding S4 domain-containing protein [Pirellulaceae bacterium]